MARARQGVMGHIHRRRRRPDPDNDTSYAGVVKRMIGLGTPEKVDDDVCAALVRLSETQDGETVLQWIHNQTLGHVPAADASEGALRESAALNRFATKFFNLLDRGLKRDGS